MMFRMFGPLEIDLGDVCVRPGPTKSRRLLFIAPDDAFGPLGQRDDLCVPRGAAQAYGCRVVLDPGG
ncbi:hypothetical protein [Actinoplanes sp. NBRC 103695]|uniref:hypothetical protein n=1 Tax=Actinoplanes sp. NBRC 103695 TaxID=3032202 RepID=UPI0024A1828B|nr:hypothetical protein [Actinoplanes sp. NBRC 103695]GLY93912.1 hypothetical protein Acsp02_11680 [Actinoplanes sp. NBRC 103695]